MSHSMQMTKTAPAPAPAPAAVVATAPAALPPAVATDRRRHRRSRTFLVATVNYGRLLLPCFIVDISTGGAKIKLLEPTQLADGPCVVECGRFGKLPAQIAWQRGMFAGVKFDEGHALQNIANLLN